MRGAGGRAHGRLCDALDPARSTRRSPRSSRSSARVDILVNAVGGSTIIAKSGANVDELSFAEWQRLIDFNLIGTFLFTHAVVPIMKRQQHGKIVNLASIAGRGLSESSSSAYAAAKGGIIAFTRKLAFELGPYGVTINAIAPSLHLDRAHPAALGPASPEDAAAAEIDRTPLRRVAEAADQAKVICFLASSDADFVTGVTIDVTGGNYLRVCAEPASNLRLALGDEMLASPDDRNGRRDMTTFVLVHGSYQGGWIWQPVADRLRAAGHKVYAPSLDGCAERKSQLRPGITTESQADEIAELLFYEDLQRCRAGRHQLGRHGGVPRRRADARPGRPAGLCRCAGAAGRRADPRHRHALDRGAERRSPPARRARMRRTGCSPISTRQTRAWALDRYTLHPIGIYESPVKLDNFWTSRGRPRVIWCTRAQNPGEAHQRRTAEKLGAKWHELDTGHYPMLSMPDELTALLTAGA